MNTQGYIYQAAGTWQQHLVGKYFRLLESGAPVTIHFFAKGREIQRCENVEAGLWIQRKDGDEFDRIEIDSSVSQAIKIATSNESGGGYDRTAGRVDAKLVSAQNLINTPKVDIPTGGNEVLLVPANQARAAVRFFNAGAKDIWIGAAGLNLVNACVKVGAGELFIEEVAAGAAWVGLCAVADTSVMKIQEITY